jgi:L-fucose isomerase-like protein
MKLALLIANRGFFPSSVIDSARDDWHAAAKRNDIELLELDQSLTRYGAIETTQEGMVYADFLRKHCGEFDGVIISLPNFGDENGIKSALKDMNVPVLLQAYPDVIGKMDFANRRDAFCGKLGLTSVFKQMNFRFTSGLPFVMHPASPEFEQELHDFISICRIVKKMRRLHLGMFGARTTAFKSVRYDEIALERHGVDVESLDMSMLFERYNRVKKADPALKDWLVKLHDSASFEGVPTDVDVALARLGVAFDSFIKDMGLDAIAVRCWSELQTELKITPCSVMGIFNQMAVPAVCETDVSNLVAMMALSLSSNNPAGCLDINNNYGSDPDKCILFHCGPLALDLMQGPGHIEEHKMFVKTMGKNCSWGINVGLIKSGEITIAGMRTDNGEVQYYIESAEMTGDPVEAEFFGTRGVMQMPDLQSKVRNLSEAGFRHHAIITFGNQVRPVVEALTKYLGYKRIDI